VVIAEPAADRFAGRASSSRRARDAAEGFQRSEFLLEKGAIDMIVRRRRLRDKSRPVTLLKREPAPQA